ncbi:RHS repeat-associated core domain-containing protein [Geodermatophilus sp. DSM 44513]|uniref:RHS repeat-associated core domain-containing protein n=1 Tax=Geodermatophilus sp. DSM 44513 TaxID=1528104 RepID=UPI00127EC73E|nr:RHS repeat-associated core domain-containing protein [Geodermatophilus sp. DSM 44513]WNV75797.1 RHS repeat-associated core domain-containing protein [Geodermatophilus sp. DSM 44513]
MTPACRWSSPTPTGAAASAISRDCPGHPAGYRCANAHYLALDGLGSIVATINHTGAQTAAYTYDPWDSMTATGVNASAIKSYQLFGYAGGTIDRDPDLVRSGQRWYDPVVGRFTQQDALETLGDPRRANRYEYAASNPINFVDPLGLERCFVNSSTGGYYCGATDPGPNKYSVKTFFCRSGAILGAALSFSPQSFAVKTGVVYGGRALGIAGIGCEFS